MVKKQVYASFSTVTSMAIVQRVNFTIRYKNQYLNTRYFSIIAQHYALLVTDSASNFMTKPSTSMWDIWIAVLQNCPCWELTEHRDQHIQHKTQLNIFGRNDADLSAMISRQWLCIVDRIYLSILSLVYGVIAHGVLLMFCTSINIWQRLLKCIFSPTL